MKILCLSFAILLSATTARGQCPDSALRSAKIGGSAIDAHVVIAKKPLRSALVVLVSNGKTVWTGVTDKEGAFRVDRLPQGDYKLTVTGWGSTSIQLGRTDLVFGHQQAYWSLMLFDHGCVSWMMDTN
jgi:hypothetical protein